jgi:hypothetical protein
MRKSSVASIADVANVALHKKGGAVPSTANASISAKLTPVTVRLTDEEFMRLKRYGTERRLKSQTILVEALRRYLDAEEGEAS